MDWFYHGLVLSRTGSNKDLVYCPNLRLLCAALLPHSITLSLLKPAVPVHYNVESVPARCQRCPATP